MDGVARLKGRTGVRGARTMRRSAGAILTGLLVVAGVLASAGPAAAEDEQDISDRALFEMCCWARGRSGFSHCVEYGMCARGEDQVCEGRGPAEGMRLRCDTPPAAPDDRDRRPQPLRGGDAAPASGSAGRP